MENKILYRRIIRNALLILLAVAVLVFLVTQDILYVYSVLLGGALSILGFLSIIYMTASIDLKGNVKNSFIVAYLVRYLIYFLCMYLGAKSGLNIISMLAGFLCINIAIKTNAVIERKEEN